MAEHGSLVQRMSIQPLCLMQIHAHPDDEASKGSGTAARYAAEGVRCVLVTCTGGEAGDILNPAVDTPAVRADLPAIRLRELDDSARILGYDAVHLLGYRDSGMPDMEENKHPDAFCNASLDEATERLVRLIRAERPHVIVAYPDRELQSTYPHPDHLRVHDVAVAAFAAAGSASRFPDAGRPWQPLKLYFTGFTLRFVRAIHDVMTRNNLESPYGERIKMLASGVTADHRYGTRIDVRDYLGHRARSLLAHRTQVAPDSSWFACPDDLRVDAYPWEDFILARTHVARHDGEFEDDLFTGIR